jgi:DNA-binding response OmpR family regulator
VNVPTDIIVVDDNKDISALLKSVLEFSGHSVAVCPEKDSLFQALLAYHPQLIVMDMMLGNDDGRDLCRLLKADPKTNHIPVLMISAHPDAGESCRDAGASAFLEKPFEMEELLDQTKALLTKAASC